MGVVSMRKCVLIFFLILSLPCTGLSFTAFNLYKQAKKDIQTIHDYIRLPNHGTVTNKNFQKALVRVGVSVGAITALVAGSIIIGSKLVKSKKTSTKDKEVLPPIIVTVEKIDEVKKAQSQDELDLISAVSNGNLEVVKKLFEKGVDANIRGKNKETVLMLAVLKKDFEMVKLLLAKGADIHAQDNLDRTALIIAARNDSKEMVELLVANGAEVNVNNHFGQTPLMLAVLKGDKERVELLLAKGANIHARDNYKDTALAIAARNNSKEMVELLLSNGAEINSKNNLGQTPLINAVFSGDKESIEILLNNGAKVNAQDNQRFTALDYAAKKAAIDSAPSSKEIIDLLKQRGGFYGTISELGLGIYNTLVKSYETEQNISREDARKKVLEKVKQFKDIYPLLLTK